MTQVHYDRCFGRSKILFTLVFRRLEQINPSPPNQQLHIFRYTYVETTTIVAVPWNQIHQPHTNTHAHALCSWHNIYRNTADRVLDLSPSIHNSQITSAYNFYLPVVSYSVIVYSLNLSTIQRRLRFWNRYLHCLIIIIKTKSLHISVLKMAAVSPIVSSWNIYSSCADFSQ